MEKYPRMTKKLPPETSGRYNDYDIFRVTPWRSALQQAKDQYFADFSPPLHLDDFDILDVFALTAEPHLNACPIDFGFDLIAALIFI